MNEQTARERFARARVARLATVDGTGRPHLVPVCFALVDGTVYSAVDAKPKSTTDLKRLRNIAANPQVAVLVDHYDDDDWDRVWWVRADGMAHVLDDGPERERGLAALVEKYPQYRVRPEALGRVVVVEVSRWSAWAASDLR